MRALPAVLAALLAASTPGAAQTLRDNIREMFTFGNCGKPLCLNVVGHGDHFIPEAVQGQDNMIGFLGNAIGASVSNVPLSAASGGATFTFRDGTPVRTALSSGPILGERAQTLGRGRFLVGVGVSTFRFRKMRGARMDGLEFNFRHANVGDSVFGVPAFEQDVIQVNSDLEVDLRVASLFVTAGVGDGLDVGIAVPLVSTSLRGRSTAHVLPFGTTAHVFDGGLESQAFTEGSARGIGDVAVRAKARLPRAGRVGVALQADVRLPTGDEDDLLGAGAASVRGLGIVSARLGGFSPHLNAGYVYRSGRGRNGAVLATLGFDQLVSPAVTLAADLVTEWQTGDNGLRLPEPLRWSTPTTRTMASSNIPDERDDVAYASLGFKVQAYPGVGVVANTLVPVLNGGLQPDATVSLGLEYTF